MVNFLLIHVRAAGRFSMLIFPERKGMKNNVRFSFDVKSFQLHVWFTEHCECYLEKVVTDMSMIEVSTGCTFLFCDHMRLRLGVFCFPLTWY